jgi:hypothetical protein
MVVSTQNEYAVLRHPQHHQALDHAGAGLTGGEESVHDPLRQSGAAIREKPVTQKFLQTLTDPRGYEVVY